MQMHLVADQLFQTQIFKTFWSLCLFFVGAVYDSADWAILTNHQSNFCLDLPESKIDGF
jgi:hypothetical protein